MATKVRLERKTLLNPPKAYQKREKEEEIELSAFDTATYDTNFSIVLFFKAPTFCNSALELALIRALEDYPEWTGHVVKNPSPSIILSYRGVLFVEATCNTCFKSFIPYTPNPNLLSLHGTLSEENDPLLQIQSTRFSCGGLAVGITASHVIADGVAACSFWIRWGNYARGISQPPRDIFDRKIIPPRTPLMVEFEHKGVEYDFLFPVASELSSLEDIIVEKVHFPAGFLKKLKYLSSLSSPRSYSTFEALTAHLWRTVTSARGIDDVTETRMRIAVNGRRRVRPWIPEGYLGNCVLWAFPAAEAAALRRQPLGDVAEIIRAAVARLDERYFRSFVDFSEKMKRGEMREKLHPTAEMENRVLSPNLEVDSWLRFPFYEVDFGSGPPDLFTPTWMPYEGYLAILPSMVGYSGVDVIVALFRNSMEMFKRICYDLDDGHQVF